MTSHKKQGYNINSLGYGVFILVCAFVMMFCISSLMCIIPMSIEGLSGRPLLLTQSCIQNIVAFAATAYIVGYFLNLGKCNEFLALNRSVKSTAIAGVVITFLFALPMLNQIIYWNANMHLPQSLSGIENVLRNWENSSAEYTAVLLSTTSVGGLIVNILVIGVLTGFCEEIFFRGALQRTLTTRGVSGHLAVWISAFIFSAVHFQFFGFVPRLLLGAFFGYLMLSTKSLWTSAFAHALNNSLVVITAWLINRGVTSSEFETLGITENGFPWFALMSMIAVTAFIYFFGRKMFRAARLKP